jgi:hypothetical protein
LRTEAALLLAFLGAASAADPTGPWARWHFVFPAKTEMSVLFRRDETGDETRLLLKSAAGRFELVSRQDPSGVVSTESVRSLEEAETLSRRLLFAFPGRGETEPACREVATGDACVVFAGTNGTFTAPLSAFAGGTGAPLRDRGAALVSPGMRRRLLDLCPLLTFAAEFGSYGGEFLGLLWPGACARPLELRRGKRTRGCDFDAGFSHACTPAEREREEKRLGADAPPRGNLGR